MAVVYIDSVFALNLSVDYLLLLAAARLAGMPLQRRRLLLCAALGGAYAAAVYLPGCGFLDHWLLRLIAGLFMAWLAYRPFRQSWRLAGLFLLLGGTLAGIVLAFSLAVGRTQFLWGKFCLGQINWVQLLFTAIGLDVLLQLLFSQGGRHGGGELMRITVSIHGNEKTLIALHDTGNTLRDPVNGQPVLVMESGIMDDCWNEQVAAVMVKTMPPEEAIAQLHRRGVGVGFTLLPFRSVGTASGLLLAVRSDYVKVGKATYPKAWVALSNTPVSDGGAYRALWGGVKRGETHAAISADAAPVDRQTQQAG